MISNKNDVINYKDYPEGSQGKKYYDSVYLPIQEYLVKYYKDIDLSRWNYIKEKFIDPLFDLSKNELYLDFLKSTKPNFFPDKEKLDFFWKIIKEDNRFDLELKKFFAFLYAIGFYRDLNFDEWLNVNYWSHPWNKEFEDDYTILQLLDYKHSDNYLKERFATLSIF